jgi:hypothetical protein
MRNSGNIYMHVIAEDGDRVLDKIRASQVPRPDDVLRLGRDRYFRVTRVVWVYDEDDCPFERVNIGVTPEE